MPDAVVRPFRGWRYDPSRAGDPGALSAPPYDVIVPADAPRLLNASPYNVIRLELPSAGGAPDPYHAAARTWQEWTSGGVLRRDEAPHFYLIRHGFLHAGQTRSRLELVGALRLAPWEHGSVLPHEQTHEGPKRDRLMLMNAIEANISPIMALYTDDHRNIGQVLETVLTRPADTAFTDTAGDHYEVRVVSDAEQRMALSHGLRGPLYIADGHHRYETALQYRDAREKAPDHDDQQAAGYIMTALTAADDPGLISLPYHRLLRGLPPDSRARLRRQVETYFHTEEILIGELSASDAAARFTSARTAAGDEPMMAMVEAPGRALTLLTPLEPGIFTGLLTGQTQAWARLAPCVFLDVLLTPGLGMDQQKAESRGLLSYPRDAAEAIDAVRSGGHDAAFLLRAVSMADMTEAARAGERLPPKSTYFFPKVAAGIVLNSLAGRLEG